MSMIDKILGHYQITSQLGKGGMGEVFQAKDQKLGRDVAIKVLPEEFARDADRVARFQREAKLLATLNHPNIAAIYGLEETDGTNFLVLELVEGDTLADRIKAGPVPVEEALKLALQIAEALEAAHEKGVIHRDLKPANIKVTPDGKVKVLDFGLAKAFAGEQADLNLSNSPTLSNAATQQGVILGTAAYMSPEQARGKTVDKRADIWAFGCVLYEMLTGQAAFQGEDITEILASVVKGGANLDLLPSNIHPRVREVITRCLQKDLKKRYPDITDARYEIEQALTDPSGVFVQPLMKAETRTRIRTMLLWLAAAIVLAGIIVGVAVWNLKPPEPRQVTRFFHEVPREQQLNDAFVRTIAVSPDGRQIVYSTDAGLYLRSMDAMDAKLLQGTGGTRQRPFFSPDSKWIGFFSSTDRKLKKIAISGGTPVTVADVNSAGSSFDWNADNTIVYADESKGIMRVSANGGTSELIIKETKNDSFYHPQTLPDGKSVLYINVPGTQGKITVQSLKSGERKELFEGDAARYLPTGHIVYAAGINLYAVRFDINALKVIGGPVSVVEGVLRDGPAQYAVSDSGTLVYVPGTDIAASAVQRTLMWVNRNGKEEPLAAQPNGYFNPRISPDGTKVALSVAATVGNATRDIWIWDPVHKTLTRLTFDGAANVTPLWAPDGKRIAFFSLGRPGIYWKEADGAGKDEFLGSSPSWAPTFLASWSDRGKTLFFTEWGTDTGIGMLSMEGDRKFKSLLIEKYREAQPQISPDGRWMAYTSDESGQNQIYVRPFPEVNSERWQISTNGGDSPLWSRDGRELLYRNGDAVMAVSVKTASTFSIATPKILFRGTYVSNVFRDGNFDLATWDVSPDGKRFLMMKEVVSTAKPAAEVPRRINIVVNWFEELKQRVPVK
jgi:serine/threonine-protein kinase